MGDATTLGWQRLAWDSDFFGIPIGSVRLDGASAAELAAVDDEAEAAGIACLYGYVDPVDAAQTVLVQRQGWRLVEVASLLNLRRSEPPIPRPDGHRFDRGKPGDLDEVIDVVNLMADWSRYATDPRFGVEQARRLQLAWAQRALDPDVATHGMFVARVDDEVVAFAGLVFGHEQQEDTVRVDAIGTTRRGSGAARYMIEMARELAGDDDLLGGPIASRNVAVHRYVANCGYRIKSVDYIFHRWLDEAP